MISDSTPDRPEFSLAGVDLEGSILLEALKDHYGDDFFIAPQIGKEFIGPLRVNWDDDKTSITLTTDD